MTQLIIRSISALRVKAVMRTWGFQTVSVKLSDPTQVLQAKQKVNHSRKYLADKLAQYSNGFSQADVNWSL